MSHWAAVGIFTILAIVELVTDQLPSTPSRKVPQQFSARIIMGSGRVGLESGHRAMTLDGNIYNSDWGIALEEVTYPIRYWHGSMDLNIPASLVEKFTRRMPHATLTVVEGEGHYSLPILCTRTILEEQLGRTAIPNVTQGACPNPSPKAGG